MGPEIILYIDIFSCVFLLLALGASFAVRMERLDKRSKVFIQIAICLLFLIMFSNFLEHAGLTDRYDSMEDYLEILFVPLMLFGLYSYTLHRQIERRKEIEKSLHENHQRLKLALQGGNLGAWELDVENEKVYLSDSFYHLLGYESGDFPSRLKEIYKRLKPSFLNAFIDFLHRLKESKSIDEANSGKFVFISKDQQEIWLSFEARKIRANHSFNRIFGIALDYTQIKNYQQDLIEAKVQAEENHRLKSAFLANMSHELRSPLNAIIGFSEFMVEGKTDPAKHLKYANIILENSKNLLAIINDILDFSKLETGQLSLYREEFQLKEVFHEVFDLFEASVKKANLEFRLKIPSKNYEIESDRQRIKQILINMVSNAIKFTPEGFILLGFSKLDDYFELFVKDSGIGIDQKNQKMIFERFHQVNDAYTKEFTGTGLGLSICKVLVDKLGGEIHVDSKPSLGSKFYFTIPINQE